MWQGIKRKLIRTLRWSTRSPEHGVGLAQVSSFTRFDSERAEIGQSPPSLPDSCSAGPALDFTELP